MADRELSNALSSGELSNIQLGGTGTEAKVLTQSEVDTKLTSYVKKDGTTSQDKVLYTPLVIAPTYAKSNMYYDDNIGTISIQGEYSDVTLDMGQEMHMRVVNNTGVTITNGQACRHGGVSGGIPQAVPALADSFDDARLLGIATHDILTGQEGILTTFGIVNGLDTSTTTVGVPLYLSDTVAGAWVETPPAIATQIGGALTQDAATGQIFINIENNKNIPTVFAGVQAQTVGNETYSVTAVAQDLNDYLTSNTHVMVVDKPTGVVTISNTGNYRMNLTADISFITSTSTRTVYLEFYDVTNATVIFTYTKNIPRDSVESGFSFNFPFNDVLDTEYKIRIRSSTNIDVTFDDISFDIQSITII